MTVDWAETRGNKEDDERGVYITNLVETVVEDQIRGKFGVYGTIEKVRVYSCIHVLSKYFFCLLFWGGPSRRCVFICLLM